MSGRQSSQDRVTTGGPARSAAQEPGASSAAAAAVVFVPPSPVPLPVEDSITRQRENIAPALRAQRTSEYSLGLGAFRRGELNYKDELIRRLDLPKDHPFRQKRQLGWLVWQYVLGGRPGIDPLTVLREEEYSRYTLADVLRQYEAHASDLTARQCLGRDFTSYEATFHRLWPQAAAQAAAAPPAVADDSPDAGEVDPADTAARPDDRYINLAGRDAVRVSASDLSAAKEAYQLLYERSLAERQQLEDDRRIGAGNPSFVDDANERAAAFDQQRQSPQLDDGGAQDIEVDSPPGPGAAAPAPPVDQKAARSLVAGPARSPPPVPLTAAQQDGYVCGAHDGQLPPYFERLRAGGGSVLLRGAERSQEFARLRALGGRPTAPITEAPQSQREASDQSFVPIPPTPSPGSSASAAQEAGTGSTGGTAAPILPALTADQLTRIGTDTQDSGSDVEFLDARGQPLRTIRVAHSAAKPDPGLKTEGAANE